MLRQQVRDAADLGYLVTVLEDGCAANTEDEHRLGLANMAGFSRAIGCADCIRELAHPAAVPAVPALPAVSPPAAGPAAAAEQRPASVASQVDDTAAGDVKDDAVAGRRAAVNAMLTALLAAKVKFLRICTVDSSAQVRSKASAVAPLLGKPDELLNGVGMVECTMGMPVFADGPVEHSGLSAAGLLLLRPDLDSLRVLPWCPGHARVFGTLHQPSGHVSPLCTRALLSRTAAQAEGMGLAMTVGVEIEFMLQRGGLPCDAHNWASSLALDEQAPFLEELSAMLEEQRVPLETVHTESAPGQFEVVISYADPLSTADHAVVCRETIAAVAKKHGLQATFLPKVFIAAFLVLIKIELNLWVPT